MRRRRQPSASMQWARVVGSSEYLRYILTKGKQTPTEAISRKKLARYLQVLLLTAVLVYYLISEAISLAVSMANAGTRLNLLMLT